MFDFFKSLFHSDEEKKYAKQALSHGYMVRDNVHNFIPFIKIWNKNDNDRTVRCVAPGLTGPIDQAYEMLCEFPKKETDTKAYALVYLDSYMPIRNNIIYLNCECGLIGNEKSSKYGKAYALNKDNTVRSKMPGLQFAGTVANAFSKKKSAAWAIVNEVGTYEKSLSPLPTVLAIITCIQENRNVPEKVFEFLLKELKKWMTEYKENKAILMGAGLCFKALSEGDKTIYFPEGKPDIDLYKQVLHHGNQVLIEATAAGLIELSDLKECFAKFITIPKEIFKLISVDEPSENNKKMLGYLENISQDPLKYKATL